MKHIIEASTRRIELSNIEDKLSNYSKVVAIALENAGFTIDLDHCESFGKVKNAYIGTSLSVKDLVKIITDAGIIKDVKQPSSYINFTDPSSTKDIYTSRVSIRKVKGKFAIRLALKTNIKYS